MKKTTCTDCKGSGFVPADPTPTRGPISGRMLQIVAKSCDNCNGSGTIIVLSEVLAVFTPGRAVA